MQYTLTKGNTSNYEVKLTVTPEEMSANKEKVMKQFQKDMELKGFRKGEVPLDMVEKNVQPTYVQLALFEEAVHQGTMQIVKEHEEIKFIWNIYDLGQEEKDGTITFSYKLDVYPEVEVSNKNWEKASIAKIDSDPTPEELEETLVNLQKQYADYQPYERVEADTVSKVSFKILDETWAEMETWSLYLWNEELNEFEIMQTSFGGKKENEEVQIDYADSLPPMLHLRNKEAQGTPTHIKATVSDIKKVTLPERNEATISKIFGNEELKTLDELKAKVTEAISSQKKEALLMQSVETYLQDVQWSFAVIIPKTLTQEEVKSRIESLKERFGGEEWLTKYYEQIGEEEKNKMHGEIESAAKSSLEKFFLLRKVIESTNLDIKDEDRQTPLAIETKLYDHFNK